MPISADWAIWLSGKSFLNFSNASIFLAGSVIRLASMNAFWSGGVSRTGGLASSPAGFAAAGCAGVGGLAGLSWALAPARTSDRQRVGRANRAVMDTP